MAILRFWHRFWVFISRKTEKLIVMKKFIIFLIAVPLVLSSCYRTPYADFFVSRNVVDIGEAIYFTNNSIDADYFEWDFGDGNRAYAFNASHIYTYDGTFTVTLFAFSENRLVDKAMTTITVLFPTTLEVTVLEYYDEYEVVDASVILYNTYDDWLDEYNPLVEGFTNQFGWTSFSNLREQRYYVDVWEANHDNYTLADEDVAWIETHVLVPNEINYFIAYVDYYETAKKSEAIRDRSRKLMKIEKFNKRDYEDKMESIEARIRERKELRAKQIDILGKEEKNIAK